MGKKTLLKIWKRATRLKLFSLSLLVLVVAAVLRTSRLGMTAHYVVGVWGLAGLVWIVWELWQDVRTGMYGVNILLPIALVSSLLLKHYWTASGLVLLYASLAIFMHLASARSKREVQLLGGRLPKHALVLRKGKKVLVAASEVHPGEKLIIEPGDVVPVDATIIEGSSIFDELDLTSETVPLTLQVGSEVLGGSLNTQNVVTVKATSTSSDSMYQHNLRRLRAATASRSAFLRLAERYSFPYTFASIAIGLTVWLLSHDATRFLDVLVIATPAPFLLAPAVALVSGLTRASRYGIFVHSLSTFEQLAEAETIATSTRLLSQGATELIDLQSLGDQTPEAILQLAASVYQSVDDPLRSLLINAAQTKELKLVKAKHLEIFAQRGAVGSIKSQSILVGNLNLMKEKAVTMPSGFKAMKGTDPSVYVAINGVLEGSFRYRDDVRTEAKTGLSLLKKLGIKHSLLVTVADAQATEVVAKEMGIEKFESELSPAGVLSALSMVKYRPLLFVGAGNYDAAALTAADIGVLLGSRHPSLATDAADVTIVNDDFARVATTVRIAKRTFSIAQQCVAVFTLLNLALMLVAATGYIPAWIGIGIQFVLTVLLVGNALRAHSSKQY